MAVPIGRPVNPFDFEDFEVKAAATETRRHAPMLGAMQALATENEALKKEVKLLKEEIERLRRGTRATTGPDRGTEAVVKAHDEFLKMFELAREPKKVMPPSSMPMIPPPMEGKRLIMGKSGDFVLIDELETITGIEAVERGRRAGPSGGSAKGFEWDGAWDDDTLA